MAVAARAALLALLALLSTVCSANRLLATYSAYPNRLQLATVGTSSLSDIKLGETIALPGYDAIGYPLYSTVKGSLAFTASLRFDANIGSFATVGKSYITVTDLSTRKVIVSRQLLGLRSGPLKGCPVSYAFNTGDLAVVKTGASSYRVYVTLACHAKCRGVADRTYVVYYTYSTTSKSFKGPSKYRYKIGSIQSCFERHQPTHPLALSYISGAGSASGLYAVVGRPGFEDTDKKLSLYHLKSSKRVLRFKTLPQDGNTCGVSSTIISPSDFASVCQGKRLLSTPYDFRKSFPARKIGAGNRNAKLIGLTHGPTQYDFSSIYFEITFLPSVCGHATRGGCTSVGAGGAHRCCTKRS